MFRFIISLSRLSRSVLAWLQPHSHSSNPHAIWNMFISVIARTSLRARFRWGLERGCLVWAVCKSVLLPFGACLFGTQKSILIHHYPRVAAPQISPTFVDSKSKSKCNRMERGGKRNEYTNAEIRQDCARDQWNPLRITGSNEFCYNLKINNN